MQVPPLFRSIRDRYHQAYSGLPKEVWLISITLLISRCGTMVLPFIAIYFKDELAFKPFTIGILLAVYGAGSVIGTLCGGWLTNVIGPLRVQVLSLALSIPAFLMLATRKERQAIL